MTEPEHPPSEQGDPAATEAPAARGPDWLTLALLLVALLNLALWLHNRYGDVAPLTLSPSPAGDPAAASPAGDPAEASPAGPDEEAAARDGSESSAPSSPVSPPVPPAPPRPAAAPPQPTPSPLPITIGEPLLSAEIGEYNAALSFLQEQGVDVKPIQEADERALKARMGGDLQGEKTHNLAALAAAQRLLLELASKTPLQEQAGGRDRSEEFRELVSAGKLGEAILVFKEVGPKSTP